MRLNVCVTVFLISAISCWRNQSGIKLNAKPTQAYSSYGGRGRSSIQIGKGFGLKDVPTTTMSTTASAVAEGEGEAEAEAEAEAGAGAEETGAGYVTKPQIRNHRSAFNLTIGIVVPFKNFGTREYTKALTSAITALKKKDHEKQFKMNFRIDMLNLMAPSPIHAPMKLSKEEYSSGKNFIMNNLDAEGLSFYAKYLEKEDIFKMLFQKNCVDNPRTFWTLVREEHPNLAKLGLKLSKIPASSAQLERVFSNWSFIHNPTRNRLSFDRSTKLIHVYYSLKITDENKCNEY